MAEYEARLLLRRLEVAGLLRDAWWNAASAARDVRVARDRLGTSRDIARDVQRRVDLGDIPYTDALLARNENLAAELGLAQAEAALVERPRGLPHASPAAPNRTLRPSRRPAGCARIRRCSRPTRGWRPRKRRRGWSRPRRATTRRSACSAATRKGGSPNRA